MRKATKQGKPSGRHAPGRKQAKNLLLAPDALLRGEQYSRRHGTSLSRLVGDFLRSLPLEPDDLPVELAPAVARLHGVAAGGDVDARTGSREHLAMKYDGG